jgi:hypothetical protein
MYMNSALEIHLRRQLGEDALVHMESHGWVFGRVKAQDTFLDKQRVVLRLYYGALVWEDSLMLEEEGDPLLSAKMHYVLREFCRLAAEYGLELTEEELLNCAHSLQQTHYQYLSPHFCTGMFLRLMKD